MIEHLPGRAWLDGVGFRQQPGVDVHMTFMRSLYDRGLLVLGGPFLDDAGGTHVLHADHSTGLYHFKGGFEQ